MLRFSAVARTVVAQATMYFLVIVLVQISIQVSVPLMEVRSFAPFPVKRHGWAKQGRSLRLASLTRFHFRECAVAL